MTAETRFLDRPDGRIAYTVTGRGPLVVAVPGMGDLRSTFRDVVPPLVAAGYRVAVTDLRGHGESDTTFRRHGDDVTGADVLALIAELGGPAVVMGNSMGAGAAAWAAAENPDAVAGLVLLGPFLRNPSMARVAVWAGRVAYRVLFRRPWGARVWASYFTNPLNRGVRSPWLDEHVADLRTAMSDPSYLRSFRELTVQLDHSVVEARLDDVHAPALAIMGSVDPDFTDPAAELAWIGDRIGAETVMIENVAHYPQIQRPDVVVEHALPFLAGLRAGDDWRSRA